MVKFKSGKNDNRKVHRNAKNKRGGKGKKLSPEFAALVAETQKRASTINSYINLIPARAYLSGDIKDSAELYTGLDPLKVKTTSSIVTEAVKDVIKKEKEERRKEQNGEKKLSKSAKRKLQKFGAKQDKKPEYTSSGDTRTALKEKLERKIKELKEERERIQSENDKAKAAAIRATREASNKDGKNAKSSKPVSVANTKDEKNQKSSKPAPAAPVEKDTSVSTGGPEAGRIAFDFKDASVPFEASVGKKGDKMRRMRAELRKAEHDSEKLRKAEQQGRGEEARLDIAMEKALKRARGEKVHDDVGKLRKAQRVMEAKKQKGKEKWENIRDTVKQKQEEAIAKREGNLAKRTENKKKKNLKKRGLDGVEEE